MRSFAFNLAYWSISIAYVLMAAVATLIPGQGAVRWVVRRYVHRMVWAMRALAGIRIEYRGRERLPPGGLIVAAKHQSWGDGFSIYNQFDDLAFVIGSHMDRYPLIPQVLNKLGAIVVDNCGGAQAKRDLAEDAARAHAAGRKILIYPEGHLAPVGKRFRYRSGVWHMYRDFGLPVVPTATNLGLFWPEDGYRKTPGTAVLEFGEPIPPGLTRTDFMTRLESAIETRTAKLVAEARGGPVVLAELDIPEAEKPKGDRAVAPPPAGELPTAKPTTEGATPPPSPERS